MALVEQVARQHGPMVVRSPDVGALARAVDKLTVDGPWEPASSAPTCEGASPLVPLNHTVQLERHVALAPDLRQRVVALTRLALWCAETERSRAPHVANRAVSQATVLGDPVLLAKARYAKAVADVLAKEDPEQTAGYYHDLARLGQEFRAMSRELDAAWCDLMAGIALEQMGDPGGTILLVERACATFRRFGDLGGQARCLNTLGIQQSLSGRNDEALNLFRRAADMAAAGGRAATHAMAWLNAAEACVHMGQAACLESRVEVAHGMFERANAEFEPLWRRLVALGHRHLQPRLASIHALTLARLGHQQRALAEADRAIALATTSGLRQTLGVARCFAGEVRLIVGDWELSRETFVAALTDCAQWMCPSYTARLLRGLVTTNEALGDLPTALRYQKQLLDVELIVRDQAAAREREVTKARLQLSTRGADTRMAAAELMRANRALVAERDELERQAHTDAITGLPNRRLFDSQLARMAVRSELTNRPLSLILIDIDHFKQINDQYTHLVGDDVLRRIATTLQRTCRRGDVAARVGGEEFAIIVPGMEVSAAIVAAERFRRAVRECDVTDIAPNLMVTVSAGVAAFRPGLAPHQVYAAADAALYQAKETGRNRVCIAAAVVD